MTDKQTTDAAPLRYRTVHVLVSVLMPIDATKDDADDQAACENRVVDLIGDYLNEDSDLYEARCEIAKQNGVSEDDVVEAGALNIATCELLEGWSIVGSQQGIVRIK